VNKERAEKKKRDFEKLEMKEVVAAREEGSRGLKSATDLVSPLQTIDDETVKVFHY
jgi:hypothetical protein